MTTVATTVTDPIERSERLASFACREASTLLNTNVLTASQARRCAAYCQAHADACKVLVEERLDRAWLVQYRLWRDIAGEWEEIAVGLEGG